MAKSRMARESWIKNTIRRCPMKSQLYNKSLVLQPAQNIPRTASGQTYRFTQGFDLRKASSDIANKMQIGQRIEILEKQCLEKLSPEERDRVNVMLNRVNDLRDMRNFPAHSLVYSSGDGEFHFHKYAERLESQVGTPEEMMAKIKQLQTWTAEFADLFQQIRPAYSSWFRQVVSSD